MDDEKDKRKTIAELIDEAKARNNGKVSKEDSIQIGIEICRRADEVTD